MENKNIYAKGLYFNPNSPNTPEEVKKWKKGGLSIHVEKLMEQVKELEALINDKGYLNFDLVQNEKDGKRFLSFKLNTWKPEPKADDVDPADIPF